MISDNLQQPRESWSLNWLLHQLKSLFLLELPALFLEPSRTEAFHPSVVWQCSNADWSESCLFPVLSYRFAFSFSYTETELKSYLKLPKTGPTYFHLPLTLHKLLAVSCCGGNNSAAQSSDEVFKLKTSVGKEKWFRLQYSLVVWVIWLCTIPWGKRGNESNRGKGETQRG